MTRPSKKQEVKHKITIYRQGSTKFRIILKKIKSLVPGEPLLILLSSETKAVIEKVLASISMNSEIKELYLLSIEHINNRTQKDFFTRTVSVLRSYLEDLNEHRKVHLKMIADLDSILPRLSKPQVKAFINSLKLIAHSMYVECTCIAHYSIYSESLLRQLVPEKAALFIEKENSPEEGNADIVWFMDSDLILKYANSNLRFLTEQPVHHFLNQPVSKYLDERTFMDLKKLTDKLRATKQAGDEFPVEKSIAVIKNPERQNYITETEVFGISLQHTIGFLGISTVKTVPFGPLLSFLEGKTAILGRFYESAPFGVMITNRHGTVLYINSLLQELIDYQEIRSKDGGLSVDCIEEIIPIPDTDEIRLQRNRIHKHRSAPIPIEIYTLPSKNGELTEPLFVYFFLRVDKDDAGSLIIGATSEKIPVRSEYRPGIDAQMYQELIQNYSLSKREAEVARHLLKGHSNKEIAFKLHVAEITVKKHVSSIYRKLNVNSRFEFFKKIGALS